MSFCIAPTASEGRASTRCADAGSPRILFVTPYLPSVPRFGGQRRLHGLISALARWDDVSVLSFVDPTSAPAEDVEATRRYCRRVVTVPSAWVSAEGAAKRVRQVRALLSQESYEWRAHCHSAFQRALDDLLATGEFDIVQFEFAYMARYVTCARRRALFVLDEHNIEYDIGRQTSRRGHDIGRRLYHAINWRKLRDEERRAWREVDGCALTSANDRDRLLADAPGTHTAVVPNAVDLDEFRPGDPSRTAHSTLLFFGAIDYYPNTEGLLFFLDEILPRVRARRPAARLCIVGRRPPAVIACRHGRGVDVVGEVEDVRPYIEEAAVVVVPLRVGSGTRLKVLEAMAMGKAIVSTSLGSQGLDIEAERQVRIADDAESFASKVVDLLADPAWAHRLGEEARRLAEARYGWAASARALRDFHRELLTERARGSIRHA
jgi:glycosyltransferase involved in cell wall biosynthesis